MKSTTRQAQRIATLADPTRRTFLSSTRGLGLLASLQAILPSYARAAISAPVQPAAPRMVDGAAVFDLTIAQTAISIAGRRGTATTINGTLPGPLLRFREGQQTILRVTNRLDEDTSIHWHGLLVPPEMDGVPGVSFPGIRPGETFEYRFVLQQYGTYWYHSHSGLQEQLGHYGPLLIEPAAGTHPYRFDREHVVLLSDWTFENPGNVLAKLKKEPDYYNFQKRTVFDFIRDARREGLLPAFRDRMMWAKMRMNPTDIADVTGATYTYLMNGLAPASNWTALFKPGERVLLHFINAAANSFFDVRIPGLPMTLVQASGQYVKPVETDEFRIAVAETYDVIVEPSGDRAYTIFAESFDRSGYARGTLAPREGMSAPVPPRRRRPVLTMADMGMGHGPMGGTDHGSMPETGDSPQTRAGGVPSAPAGHQDHAGGAKAAGTSAQGHEGHSMGAAKNEGGGHDQAGHGPAASKEPGGEKHADHAKKPAGGDQARYAEAGAIRYQGLRPPGTLPGMLEHEPDSHGPGNSAVPMMVQSRLSEPGIGLGEDGWRVLRYTDLRALERRPDFKAPAREIEMHLTGNMERFMWSIDGVAFADSKPIPFTHGERLRLTMVNDTMMNHPMHLHGMWMELENGHGEMIPRVHTVNVKPAERLSLLITADAAGPWAFHCHMLYHMEVGMFRVVEVKAAVKQPDMKGHHHES